MVADTLCAVSGHFHSLSLTTLYSDLRLQRDLSFPWSPCLIDDLLESAYGKEYPGTCVLRRSLFS